MKKSFLALAVAALAASSIASTASAATVYDKDGTSLAVYGRVQSVFYSDKASNLAFKDVGATKADEQATLKTSGRLGVDMRTQVFGDIAAFGKMEWDVTDGDGSDKFGARYLWVGLDFAQAGQVKVGRFEPAMKYAISQTDIFDDWGCTGLAGNDDKRDGTIQYQWSGMGFDFLASYSFAKKGEHVDGAHNITRDRFTDNESNRETLDVDYTVSFAAGYTSPDVLFGPIAIRAGYEKGEMADSANNVYGGDNANNKGFQYDSYDQFAVGLSWGSLNMGPYIAAEYQKREFDINGLALDNAGKMNANQTETVSGYEFVVGYSFANGVAVRTGYLHQTYEYDKVDVDAATIPVYVGWQINPQFNVWAEARFDASTDEDENKNTQDFDDQVGTNYAENVFSAGLRYQF